MTTKVTSSKVARSSSRALSNRTTGKSSKSTAGSALSQVTPKKVTSAKVATIASKVLRDGRTSVASKSVAGSTLTQRSIHQAPKKGSLSLSIVRKAVTSAIGSRKK